MENVKEMQKQRESQRLPGLGTRIAAFPSPQVILRQTVATLSFHSIISTPKSRSQNLKTSTQASNVPTVLFCKIKHLACSTQNQKRSLLLSLWDLGG